MRVGGKFKNLIAQHVELGEIDEWGKRRLAYPINDETEGYYVLYNFAGGPEFPAELNRVSKITSGCSSLPVRPARKEKSAKAKATEKKAEEKTEEKAEQ